MFRQYILEREEPTEPTPWLSKFVQKTEIMETEYNNVDAKKVNNRIGRVNTQIPKIKDLCYYLNCAKYIGKIDLRSAFYRIEEDT